jgi:tetratricopeptide (TPR) repeat protein
MSDLLIEQFCVMLSEHLESAVGIPMSKAESARYLQAVIQADAKLRAVFEDRMVQFNQGNSTGFQTWLESGAKGFFGTNYIVSDPAILQEGLRSLLDELAKQPVGTPSNLPLSGVVKFVGRDEALEAVHEKLQQTTTVAITSVSGMGGVGKTELALQYAYGKLREMAYPGGICWIQARSQDVGIGILEFARDQLGLPQPPEEIETVPQQVKWVCGRWRGEPILMVLDDVTDYANVKPYLEQLDPRFRVLMTTRLKLGTPGQRLELEVLTEEAALELLRVLVDDAERINSQLEDAKRLCEWLGCLPLGLELVGRYLVEDEDISLAEVLELLKQERLAAEALLEAYPEMTASLGVATAFQLSWKELDNDFDAKKLSCLLGIFAVAPIPWELVEQCLPDWEKRRLALCRDKQLKKRSLLKRIGQARYQLHQLIREFFAVKLQTELSDEAETLQQRFAEVLTAVAKTIPQTVTLDVIARVEDALPHLAVVAERLTDLLEGGDKIWSMIGLARVAQAQSFWQEAERWYQRSLHISETQLGTDHPFTATSLNNLAALYYSTGRYSEAEPLFRRSLQIRETQLGNDHPLTATSLNNLAALYRAMGRTN